MKRSLAIVAVLFLLARPFCDVLAAGHAHAAHGLSEQPVASTDGPDGHGLTGPACCASVQDGSLTTPSGAITARASAGDTTAFAVLAWGPRGLVEFAQDGIRHPPDGPFTQLSYYARSARVRR